MTDEQTLIRLARAGDGPAFEALVTAYETRLYQLAFRYLGHREDALDAVQETFLRVYRFLGGFQEQSSFSTWIYRIAINVCRDLSLQRSRRAERPLERGEDGEPSPAETLPDLRYAPETRLEQQELRRAILQGLHALPRAQKEILLLREVQGLSYEEIGAALSLGPGTVRSRLARAREALRKKLLQSGNIFDFSPSNPMKGGKSE